ncbi:MAG: 4-amino-4-deoxy-L-arabinose transferase [Parcubacteria group bacterium GW2011_GWC1_45_14]|nr:MAG: Glycosyl transferase, family 39 [Candidatus Moranbacteria bacterium GW2011_GWC2_45_10]KKT95458.1 MAG: 4-amino-4-deoxy-L-arabinose transferase [Parcubacteria group bacterium GW2011_GWC1_45_14]
MLQKIDYFLKRHSKKLVLTMMSFVLAVSLLNAKNDGATYDEVAHIPASYSYLSEHDMRLNPEHPPLLKDLAGLPLQFLDLNFDTTHSSWTTDNVADNQWNAGRKFLYGSGNDPDRVIFWSRVPFILLALALGLFIFRWTKEIASIPAALLALALYAFNPNVLGHNHLVTTDLGIAAFITFSFYYFLKFIKQPSWKNVFLAGLFLGLLQLAKFSSVIAFPVFFLLVVGYPLIKKTKPERKKIGEFFEYVFKGFLVFAVSIAAVWALYAFNTSGMPVEVMNDGINHYFKANDSNIKTIYTRKALFAINEHEILQPLGEYLFGVARVFQRVAGGNVTYFMGEVSNDAKASYFPLVFLMKEPLPILVLLFFTLAVVAKESFFSLTHSFKRSARENITLLREFLHSRITETALLSFIIIYSFVSITGNLNIGFRHLFPIFPFAYILLSKKIFSYRRKDHHKKNFINVMIVTMVFWLIIEAVASYPYYISYFNQVAGGPSSGYQYVTDSNADWGQDIKRLKTYLEENPRIDKIRVNYFGGGDVNHYLGEDKVISWWDARRPVENGWYAISVLFIQESLHDERKSVEENYSWLKKYSPVAQVGTSILIYHVTDIK